MFCGALEFRKRPIPASSIAPALRGRHRLQRNGQRLATFDFHVTQICARTIGPRIAAVIDAAITSRSARTASQDDMDFVLPAPWFSEDRFAKTAALVGAAAFIARSLLFLNYFAAAVCGGGGGLGSDVSIQIFHCPFSRTSRAVQITFNSRGSPFSLLPVTRASPVTRAMFSDND